MTAADELTPNQRQALIAALVAQHSRYIELGSSHVDEEGRRNYLDRAGELTAVAHALGLHGDKQPSKADAWDDLVERVQRAMATLELDAEEVGRQYGDLDIDAEGHGLAAFQLRQRRRHLESKRQGVSLVLSYMAEYKVHW